MLGKVDQVLFEGATGDVGTQEGGNACWHCEWGKVPLSSSSLIFPLYAFGNSNHKISTFLKVAQLLADNIEHNRCFVLAMFNTDPTLLSQIFRWIKPTPTIGKHCIILSSTFSEGNFDFVKAMHGWGLESITALALDTRLSSLTQPPSFHRSGLVVSRKRSSQEILNWWTWCTGSSH